jgi:hypothetical protein
VRREDTAASEAPALLRLLWADPQHMAEHLALWSVRLFGPRASAAVRTLERTHPGAERSELSRLAVERQTRVSMTEGAFVGGPFVVLIPVAFCAALLAQAQMALELAGLSGRDPEDQVRAADLLVLQGAYRSVAEASSALEHVVREPKHREGRLPRGSRIAMVRRMAYLLGMLGPSGEKKSRLRQALGIALLCVVFLVSFAMPLVWVPYMAASLRRSALQVGGRATAFYTDGAAAAPSSAHEEPRNVSVGIAAGFSRTVVLIAVPVVGAAIALLTGLEVGGSRLVGSGVLLVVLSQAAAIVWLVNRWWRRRRIRHSPARPQPARP